MLTSKRELFQKVTYKYDSNGNQVEEIWLDNEGEILLKITDRFNTGNYLIEKEHYNSQTETTEKTLYQRDTMNNIEKQIVYLNGEIARMGKTDIEFF